MTLKAIGLIAVSSAEQVKGVSLEEQARAIRERCQKEGLQLLEPLITLPGVSRSDPDIIDMFAGDAPQYEPYRQVRRMIKSRVAQVLVSYDDGRVGRSKSMFVYIAENALANKMRVLLLTSGWIDEDNEDYAILMGSIRATTDMKRRVKMGKAAIEKRIERGLPKREPPISHRVVRDEMGRGVRVELREGMERFWADVATLVLEGVSWRDIGHVLYERYGHVNPRTGKPFREPTLYRIMHNPFFWGYAAIGYRDQHGVWAFDENAPCPPDLKINRNPNPPIPPVYTGKTAERIKAELIRRADTVKGRARPQDTARFSGLLVCSVCGWRLTVHRNRQHPPHVYYYYRCAKSFLRGEYKCSNKRLIRETLVIEQVNDLLVRWMALTNPDIQLFVRPSEDKERQQRAISLRTEIDQLRAEIDTLIMRQAKAPLSVQDMYAQQIEQRAARLTVLGENLKVAETKTESPAITHSRELSYAELQALGLERFWQLPSREINQWLHRLLGKHRFSVADGLIVDLI
ncbi:MAG: recombinase zinc beta ribbon domain-containing protein [Anaerolineae bacterium]|nr:recombinase zinc beta ribbon domain-containing protein [Anaerolineae bacterium]